MILSISEKIVDKLTDSNIIESEDKDLYTYGFYQGFLIIFNILTAIAIGLLFKMVWESLVFLMAYIPPLRSYAGGISCQNPPFKVLYVFLDYYNNGASRNKAYILE